MCAAAHRRLTATQCSSSVARCRSAPVSLAPPAAASAEAGMRAAASSRALASASWASSSSAAFTWWGRVA